MRNLSPLPLLPFLSSTTLAAAVHANHDPPHLARRSRNDGPEIAIGVCIAAGIIAIAFAIWCCRQKPWVTPDKPRVERALTMPPSYGVCLEEMRPPDYAASSTSGRPSRLGLDGGRVSPPPYGTPVTEPESGAPGADPGRAAVSGGVAHTGVAPISYNGICFAFFTASGSEPPIDQLDASS
ncbi:hypothetical protein QBC34DRAFT_498707 [Podospora aff. communis PSN243]|uniref:Uncharacterized protein n=1 Tax=Podospora aff. communis PSN243 TaxID=3040156 RepID=A0AAV9G5Y1_9PEZI|nr:hypothetical protein QBC34DRAFT_498707 [Podospora aff. communis PSN243]